MPTKHIVWDRQDAKQVGPVFDTTAQANTYLARLPRHDGGKKSAIVFDVVQVTVN